MVAGLRGCYEKDDSFNNVYLFSECSDKSLRRSISAVTKDGSRTDTAVDGEGPPSITGTIKGDTAIVDVHSAYSDAVLKVRLTLHDRSLNWKVLQVKQSGEHYIPDKATLSKEH